MLVRTFMTHHVVSIQPETTIQQAIEVAEANDFDALPVVDAQQRPVGVVTQTVLYRSADRSLPVRGIMSDRVFTISPDDALEQAAHLMLHHDLVLLNVVNDLGRLIGVVSHANLMRGLHDMLGCDAAGTRVTLLLPDVVGQVEQIGRVARRHGVQITHLATLPYEKMGMIQMVVRLGTTDPEHLVRSFRDLHYQVLHVTVTRGNEAGEAQGR